MSQKFLPADPPYNSHMKNRLPEGGGIYFLVPFPNRWELVAYRSSTYPDVGHALIWELLVAPHVAMRWAGTLYSLKTLDENPTLITGLTRRLSSLYDAVPRGRAAPPVGRGLKYHIYHGNDISGAIGISKTLIESALQVNQNCVWRYDEHETRNIDSMKQLAEILNLERYP